MAPKKTGNNEESEADEKESGRTSWSKAAVHTFFDICIDCVQRSKGKRGSTVSQRIPWKLVESEFQKRTKLAYDRNKLKNKWDWMKTRYNLWKSLKGKETGLGWDHEKGTISASEEWWNNKIKENIHFKAFRDEGIENKLEQKMDQLFSVSSATGDGQFSPVMDPPQGVYIPSLPQASTHSHPGTPTHSVLTAPNCSFPTAPSGAYVLDDEMGESGGLYNSQTNMEWDDVWKDPTPSPQSTENERLRARGKRAYDGDTSDTGKSAKTNSSNSTRRVGGAATLLERLDFVVQTIAERNTREINMMSLNAPTHDFAESLAYVMKLPGLVPGTDEFSFACSLMDPKKRTIPHTMPNDHARLEWIKFLFAREKARMDLQDMQNGAYDSANNVDNEFWDLMAIAAGYLSLYFIKYIYKEPCMTSLFTGQKWMNELLNGHEKRCFNMFRMNQSTFRQLCIDLETKYGLMPSDRMSTIEKVGVFVYILSKGASNTDAQERFQHSGETISRVFKEVLDAMDGLSRDMLRPRDPEFKEIPPQIVNDTRYMPHFKHCIGAIDGTHIDTKVPEEDQLRYRGRKGTPTINVMAAYDFDLLFIYVLSGWEGSAHDSRIFLNTIGNPRLNYPKPPPGKYYLADKGYPEREGYLTPYPKTNYHPSQFRGVAPRGSREIFNRAHSSLRSCIERAFGVLKARWRILDKMPRYSLHDQNRIICGAFTLHNYIRKSSFEDPTFKIIDGDPNFIPHDVFFDIQHSFTHGEETQQGDKQVAKLRDDIAASLINNRRRRSRT